MNEPAAVAGEAGAASPPNPGEQQRIAALPFDTALAEFKQVVEKLESGNLPLEQSIALFELGVQLQRRCEAQLTEAELRFQRLVEQGGAMRTLDLSPSDAGGEEA